MIGALIRGKFWALGGWYNVYKSNAIHIYLHYTKVFLCQFSGWAYIIVTSLLPNWRSMNLSLSNIEFKKFMYSYRQSCLAAAKKKGQIHIIQYEKCIRKNCPLIELVSKNNIKALDNGTHEASVSSFYREFSRSKITLNNPA